MTAEKIKPFSKEWWLKMSTYGDLWFRKDGRPVYFPVEARNYCAKRYAKAYHREKMKQFDENWADTVPQRFFEIERNRILGIIKSHDFWFITDRDELIEKIKG